MLLFQVLVFAQLLPDPLLLEELVHCNMRQNSLSKEIQ